MNTTLQQALRRHVDTTKAAFFPRFFKSGPGEYGEGDIFIGVTVPHIRRVVKLYASRVSLKDIDTLLHSDVHEDRLCALLLLVAQFQSGDDVLRRKIYTLYMKRVDRVNNWDLVDSSASYIVGAYLAHKPKDILVTFARSRSLWKRRIAIIATFYFIRQGKYQETFRIARILLSDSHDLIHKAVGWMLREVGKHCSEQIEEQFLRKHYTKMPRTMLRYAIERFDKQKRQAYLDGRIV